MRQGNDFSLGGGKGQRLGCGGQTAAKYVIGLVPENHGGKDKGEDPMDSEKKKTQRADQDKTEIRNQRIKKKRGLQGKPISVTQTYLVSRN